MKIVLKEDKAVSPIIATVLLVAITVVLISTAYSLISSYIPKASAPTPTALLEVSNSTSISGTNGSIVGSYNISLNSLNGRLLLSDTVIVLMFQNGTVLEQNLGQINGKAVDLLGNLVTINMTGDSQYLSSTSNIGIQLNYYTSFLTYVALKDIRSDGTVGSSFPK